MNQPIITDSDRTWAAAFVNSCRYVAEHTGQPFNEASVTAGIREALTSVRRYDPRDEFEPVAEDLSDPGNEGADISEARETKWRDGR